MSDYLADIKLEKCTCGNKAQSKINLSELKVTIECSSSCSIKFVEDLENKKRKEVKEAKHKVAKKWNKKVK